jgi:hypothetical protein
MSTETLFQIHLVSGYVVWLLCLRVYVLPRLKSMDPVEAHRAIATLHSFRFFGLVFILPGVVGPNLPAGFATFAAYGDLATGLLQSRGLGRHHPRLLPRHPGRPSRAGGRVRCRIRNPDHLRALTDDHALHLILSVAAPSAQGGSDIRRRCGRILDPREPSRAGEARRPASPGRCPPGPARTESV